MNTLFPFGFPGPTAFYLVLYVLTLVVHVLFMNYVFAGCGYLAVVSLLPGAGGARAQGSVAVLLRDWMPFVLSAAITAGVAPLLFIQILYPHSFHSANLLLFHRWMAILPVLTTGFYLLYLFKSETIDDWPPWALGAVGVGAFAAVAFTGYSWTENHLLSLDAQRWTSFYADQRWFYWSPVLLPRLGTWLVGSIPTLVTAVGWQLCFAARRSEPLRFDEPRRAARLALVGLAGAVLCGVAYYACSDPAVRGQFTGRLVGPYLGLGAAGVLLQAVAWWRQRRRALFARGDLALATAGLLVTVLAMTVVREGLRLQAIDSTALHGRHAVAAAKGGVVLFGAFLVINTLLMIWAVVLVRRGLRRTVAR